jgi:hypothetical protein
MGFAPVALIRPQASEAGSGAEFEGAGSLLSSDVERALEASDLVLV